MADVVAFINMKGGVGKTTLAVNVGYTLSKEFGKKVLLIDADPQMNATQHTLDDEQVRSILDNPKKSLYGILLGDLLEEYNYPPLTSSGIPCQTDGASIDATFPIDAKFDIIPSHLKMMDLILDKNPHIIKNYIKENRLKDKYDIILIDLPPTMSTYTTISLLASDKYLVPMKTDYLSFFGLPLLESNISKLKKNFELNLEFIGIVFTMVRTGNSIYRDVKRLICKNPLWKDMVFTSELKYTTDIEKALSPQEREKKPPYIIELRNQEVVSQMISITQEFMRRLRL